MSHCETKAWGKCQCCGGAVAVKCNRSGMAYYRCDHCGVQVQHHWRRVSDKFLAEIGFSPVEEKPQPAAAPEPAAKPEKPAPKKPAPGSVASFLGL